MGDATPWIDRLKFKAGAIFQVSQDKRRVQRMPDREQPEVAELILEIRHRLELSQVEFAAKLGVCFHSVNRWQNGRTRPLPRALKQVEAVLHQLGEQGKDLLAKYFQKT